MDPHSTDPEVKSSVKLKYRRRVASRAANGKVSTSAFERVGVDDVVAIDLLIDSVHVRSTHVRF